MNRKLDWRTLAVCLVLGFGTLALYSPVFHFGFVNYEDPRYVVLNEHVNKGLTGAGVAWAFQPGYAGNWHPLTWISHMLDCQWFGLRAGGHHLTSVVLHALNGVLLFLVVKRMTNSFWRSAAVAGLFAWHPLQVESVAWIADRKDVLSAFFWMLALWAYVRYVEEWRAGTAKRKLFYAAALLWFALGLMAKPMLVTLPCVLLLLDWWPLRRVAFVPPTPENSGATKSVGFLLVEKIPFFCLSALSILVTVVAQHRGEVVSQLPFKVRLLTAEGAYFRYLEKIVWPSDLGAMYPYFFHRPKWEVLAIGVLLAGLSIIALQLRKTRPYWLAGWFWFAIMVFPTTNLVASNDQAMADRYMYLPAIGLFILICWEVYDLAAQSDFGRKAMGGLCVVALAGCCVASASQLQIWKNDGTLLSHIAMPKANYVAYGNYAAYLMHQKRLAEAEAECEKGIAIAPRYSLLYGLAGDILVLENKPDEAIAKLNAALKMDPTLVGARMPLGRALLVKRRADEAAQQFAILAQAEPRNFEARTWLAKVLELEGKTAQAISEFIASIKLQPNQPDALNDAAWILATDPHPQLRNGAIALKLAKRACELTRNQEPLMIGTLAAAYAENGQFDVAAVTAHQASDVASAQGKKAIAQRNLELQALYREHKAYRETR